MMLSIMLRDQNNSRSYDDLCLIERVTLSGAI